MVQNFASELKIDGSLDCNRRRKGTINTEKAEQIFCSFDVNSHLSLQESLFVV